MDIVYAIWLRSMKRFFRSQSGLIGSVLMPFFVLIVLGGGLNGVVSIPGLGEQEKALVLESLEGVR